MNVTNKPLTLGMIVGNRGFFPAHLCDEGRATMLKVLGEEGIRVIALTPEEARHGAIESIEEARACADLFRAHRDEIDGVLITLPNFGDERAIANALRWAELDVPVLIQAFPDDAKNMTIKDRRDSFCGKMSHCNNLKQYGIKYTLTKSHTTDPESKEFREDLARFGAICRVVRGLKHARVGAIGARPGAFNTVRFSEKLLEKSGITVETIDLSDIFGMIDRLADDDVKVTAKLDQIKQYIRTEGIPAQSLVRMAKLGAVVDGWMQEMRLDACAVQCWTSLEENFGVVPCTVMSMMSNGLIPAACETDIAGTVAMMALAYASEQPSAIVDWNNNYGDDPNKCVFFHCSNLPKDVFVDQPGNFFRAEDIPVMDYQEIIAGTVGRENTYGTIYGRIKDDPFTYLRISTDDLSGRIVAYVGEGKMTGDALQTFGGYGVAEVPELQKLLHYICENGFEHHVSMNLSEKASAVHEALEKYLGWPTYYHGRTA